MEQRLPNFFIVGAPKAGTTSLYQYLKNHPQVYMSPVKEPNFFSYDETVEQRLYHKEKGIKELDDYLKLFRGANGADAVGEASVSYLFYPSVPEKIKQFSPAARIIILLRNPVERAFSHYHMEHKMGYVNESLEEIISRNSRHRNAPLYYQQYVELGIYAPQLKRYFDQFGREHVKVLIYEEAVKNLPATMNEVYSFLGINSRHPADLNRRFNSFSAPRNPAFRFLYSQKRLRKLARSLVPQGAIERVKKIFLSSTKRSEWSGETRKHLLGIFRPDIQEVEKLLNKNLRIWYE